MTNSADPIPNGAHKDRAALFSDYRKLVDDALDAVLPPADERPALHEAMRYSVVAGGKRLRPILLLAAGEACGAERAALLPAACAVELIHTYSLVHDDLPAFDDDELRRGHPTNHTVFGEAVAVLAGDALQTLAFEHMADAARFSEHPQRWLASIRELAAAAGSRGMARGQCIDIESEGESLDIEELEALHAAKTGALLTACVRMGGILAGADDESLVNLTAYGNAIGLAFQVVDDILDVEGTAASLGKNPGVDADRGKPTYPALLGIDAAHAEADRLRDVALQAIDPFGDCASTLATVARFIVDRKT